MKKIIDQKQASKISAREKTSGKKIILTGGCFDVLHKGHIKFLENAKDDNSLLFVLLESDENIKKRKGNNRPINNQENRATILSNLSSVDYIIPLVGVTKNVEYDKLIVQIKPDLIALTKGDLQTEKREEQCRKFGAKIKIVNKFDAPSTTDLIKNYG